MELAERGMVQLMPADFEVPFFAIERVGGVVVESADGFHDGIGTTHWRREPYRVLPGDVLPLFTKTLFIQKHHGKVLDGMLFHVAVLESCAPQECC